MGRATYSGQQKQLEADTHLVWPHSPSAVPVSLSLFLLTGLPDMAKQTHTQCLGHTYPKQLFIVYMKFRFRHPVLYLAKQPKTVEALCSQLMEHLSKYTPWTMPINQYFLLIAMWGFCDCWLVLFYFVLVPGLEHQKQNRSCKHH